MTNLTRIEFDGVQITLFDSESIREFMLFLRGV